MTANRVPSRWLHPDVENEYGHCGWLDERGELTDLFFEENAAFEKIERDGHVLFRCEGKVPRLVEFESETEWLTACLKEVALGSSPGGEPLQELGGYLEWYFCRLIRDDPTAAQLYEWIDGVIVEQIDHTPPSTYELAGRIWWGERQVLDRFRAEFELDADLSDIQSHTLWLGDKRVLARRPGHAEELKLPLDEEPRWAVVLRGER